MIKVGITGGIGSGKTIICKVFELLDAPVYYSDEEAKNLLTDPAVYQLIVNTFGNVILNESGSIDRKKMAGIVFNDKEKLTKLNNIIHPAVAKHFEQWVKKHSASPYILKEAAILFESGANKQVDQVITVTAPSEIKIARVMQRDNISREQVEERIKHQMSDEEKIKLSQYLIVNDEKEMLIPQVLEIHQLLINTPG